MSVSVSVFQEFESFLFVEDRLKAERVRRNLYSKMNSQRLGKLGKRNVARKIVENLSPFSGSGLRLQRVSTSDEKSINECLRRESKAID
jgi:hypothetical protein